MFKFKQLFFSEPPFPHQIPYFVLFAPLMNAVNFTIIFTLLHSDPFCKVFVKFFSFLTRGAGLRFCHIPPFMLLLCNKKKRRKQFCVSPQMIFNASHHRSLLFFFPLIFIPYPKTRNYIPHQRIKESVSKENKFSDQFEEKKINTDVAQFLVSTIPLLQLNLCVSILSNRLCVYHSLSSRNTPFLIRR